MTPRYTSRRTSTGLSFAVDGFINASPSCHLTTRAGRAARAGRSGRVFSILRPEDVRHFKLMLRKADNTYVRDFRCRTLLLPRVMAFLYRITHGNIPFFSHTPQA